MNKVMINLVSKDGTLHARGLVELSNILDAHIVERNKRLYYFKPNASIGEHYFEECSQPYVLTEF